MNKVIREVMQLCKYNFQIIPNKVDKHDVSRVIIARWDISLLRSLLVGGETSTCSFILSMREKLRKYPILLDSFKQDGFTRDLFLAITQVKSFIERKVIISKDTLYLNIYTDSYLILSRSPEPKFYSKDEGKAEIFGYGTSRRALLGIEEAMQKLRNSGIPVTIFEPGKFSLVEQIKVFRACRGIIGIKGAEFANLIWLKPHSRVILVRPSGMNTPPVQKYLAKILDLSYVEIETGQGSFPNLKAEMLEQHLVNA